MPNTKATLLIADDEPSIRESLSQVLIEIGYKVRSAKDGFLALREIREELPDLLLSDLNMPNMSGFELLSVVRRRFPSICTVAMSGSFSGNEVPFGVAADAFYKKGSSIAALLKIFQALPLNERRSSSSKKDPPTIWIHPNSVDASEKGCVTIACPECLRTFSQPLDSSLCQVKNAVCIYCFNSIRYALVEPVNRVHMSGFHSVPVEIIPQATSAAQYYY